MNTFQRYYKYIVRKGAESMDNQNNEYTYSYTQGNESNTNAEYSTEDLKDKESSPF